MSEQENSSYEFGSFLLDPAERRLLREGEPVALAPKAFDLLVVLVRHNDHLLEKDELLKLVWPDQFVEEGNLSFNISVLRKALGESHATRQYIETVPKKGYRFAANVRTVPSDGDPRPEKNEKSPQTKVINSLAVLPFVNVSADPNIEYLSDGITESIINNLSGLSKLRVMARSTVFRYKGKEVDVLEVGRELNVGAVLMGRVLQVGERLIIRGELVNTADGSQLWGNQYNCEASDIFAIYEEISSKISTELQLKLTGNERERLKKRYTENTAAFHSYLKGRYHLNKRTVPGLKKAIEHFREAIELDPTYALAYSGLADTHTLLGSAGYDASSPPEMMSKAKATAVKALEIDETLAEAHTSLAFIRFRLDWDWEGAEKEFARAIELNPGSATSHHWYALFLIAMDRRAEAIREIKRAQELDPLSLIIAAAVGRVYHFAGQYDQALEEYHKTLEMDANYGEAHFNLGLTYAREGMYAEAIAELQEAIKLSENRTVMLAVLGHFYSMAGMPKQARSILEQLSVLSNRYYVSPLDMAIVYTGLGEKELALEWFEKAYLQRTGALIYLKVEPLYDSLRSEPRFTDLLRRMNLV